MAAREASVLDQILAKDPEKLVAMKENLSRGRAYLASLREENRSLEKAVDSAEDRAAEARYRAQEIISGRRASRAISSVTSCRDPRNFHLPSSSSSGKSGQLVPYSPSFSESEVKVTRGMLLNDAALKQEAERLSLKCQESLEKYKTLFERGHRMQKEIGELKKACEEESSLISKLEQTKTSLERIENIFLKMFDDFRRAFDLNRVAVDKTLRLETSQRDFCKSSGSFDLKTMTNAAQRAPLFDPREVGSSSSAVESRLINLVDEDPRPAEIQAMVKRIVDDFRNTHPCVDESEKSKSLVHEDLFADGSDESLPSSVIFAKKLLAEAAEILAKIDADTDTFKSRIDEQIASLSIPPAHDEEMQQSVDEDPVGGENEELSLQSFDQNDSSAVTCGDNRMSSKDDA